MSTVTSYTLLSRAAPLRKSSSTPLQAGKLAAAPAAALPLVRRKLSPLSVCHAAYTYDVPPFALVHPKFPEFSPPKTSWKITEDVLADHINLWFKVDATNKNDLEVATKGNLLLIRYTGKPDDTTAPASKLDVRLLLPMGYEKVEAELTFGSLLVTVTKPELKAKPILIGPADQA